jgi:hypothetical protein
MLDTIESRAQIGIVLLFVLFKSFSVFADERIWVKDVQLDGKPVRLFYDTGANASAVSLETAERLGVRSKTNRSNDVSSQIVIGDASTFTLSHGQTQLSMDFAIIDFPYYAKQAIDFDGFIGWPNFDRYVLKIEASEGEVTVLPMVPKKTAKWIHFSVITNSGVLLLAVPKEQDSKHTVFIDTGSSFGVGLPHHAWQQWKKSHPRSPLTLRTMTIPADGFVVLEESWADQIAIGSLVLTNVPVIEEPPSFETLWGSNNDGTLGLAALNRLDVIVDGPNTIAYLYPNPGRARDYPHNRLGAVFVPCAGHPREGVAWVEADSPAYEAGIRTGDILLKVDEIPVVSFSDTWIRRFSMPSGTKLHLVLKRDGKEFQTTATLRQIIPPDNIRKGVKL